MSGPVQIVIYLRGFGVVHHIVVGVPRTCLHLVAELSGRLVVSEHCLEPVVVDNSEVHAWSGEPDITRNVCIRCGEDVIPVLPEPVESEIQVVEQPGLQAYIKFLRLLPSDIRIGLCPFKIGIGLCVLVSEEIIAVPYIILVVHPAASSYIGVAHQTVCSTQFQMVDHRRILEEAFL